MRPVVAQLIDRLMNIREREVRALFLDAGRNCWRPSPRQLLHSAHVEIAIVKKLLEPRHVAREKSTVLADAVATHRRGARIHEQREKSECRRLRLRRRRATRADAGLET